MKKTTLPSGKTNSTSDIFHKSILLLLLFSATIVFAQQNKISDRDDFIKSLASEQKESSQHLKKLIDELQPSVYFDNGVVNAYGENPIALFTTPSSISSLPNADIAVKNIEIVTIRLTKSFETNSPIDLSVFAAYPKLKYVYILSAVPNNPQQIIRSVKNIPAQLHVFYKIDLGS